MPIMPSMPRTASELDSGFGGGPNTVPKHKPKAITPASDTSPKPPPIPAAPETPRDGTRSKENPGAVVYKTGGSMIRASRILSEAWRWKTPDENPNSIPKDPQ